MLTLCRGLDRVNILRLWIESRLRLYDDKTGVYEDYTQVGGCRSERTFAEHGPLFVEDNYHFTPVLGPWHVY